MPEVILQSMFSRILTFSGLPGWLHANSYKYAMHYLDANIKDACYSSKATLSKGNKKIDFIEIREVVPCGFLESAALSADCANS